jgi:hypothetical protein
MINRLSTTVSLSELQHVLSNFEIEGVDDVRVRLIVDEYSCLTIELASMPKTIQGVI